VLFGNLNYILRSKYKVDSDIDIVFKSTFKDYFVMYLQNIGNKVMKLLFETKLATPPSNDQY